MVIIYIKYWFMNLEGRMIEEKEDLEEEKKGNKWRRISGIL